MSKKRKKEKKKKDGKQTSRKRISNNRGRQGHSSPPKISEQVRQLFIKHSGEPLNYMNVIKTLRLRDHHAKSEAKSALFSLEASGFIRKLSSNKFILDAEIDELTGRVDHVNHRFAYVIVEGREDDIWVKTGDLKFAIDGDEVLVQVTREASKEHKAEGKVTKIIKRARKEFVGRIEISPKFSFVVLDNRNIHFDVFLFPEKIGKAAHNDKVLVRIDRWHTHQNKSPLGEVTQVLGPAGEHEAEIHSIMAEFDLPFQFPKSIETAAEKIPTTFTKEEIKSRRDFRHLTTFTIDPVDAKDFDDALSIKSIGKNKWEIGIHIADVSHYVKPDSMLDKEAVERATSVYLVDRTIPMLPEVLSNGLCSLRPNEEKMTFSAVFEMDASGGVTKKWFGRTIIESNKRFAYEDAQELIEGGEGDFGEEVRVLNQLAYKLKEKRFAQGAVNFETTEVRFKLDEKGKPVELITKERKDAHKMIEEFMLLANREVATLIHSMQTGKSEDKHKTFVYRTHDDPDPEKLTILSGFANKFGHKTTLTGNVSIGLNKLLDDIQGKPEQGILEQLAIRSMAKAKYTTEPVGHFGLAFEHYTHFTSPIRRYPDVMVHRLLHRYLDGEKSEHAESIEKLCLHSSEREKRAANAERASIKFKQVEFMQSRLGEDFEGVVSGVTEWGLFVEIVETKCEGLVRISDLEDDFYDFDSKQLVIVGRNNKRRFTLGDKVFVKVVKTDIDRRTIDLLMVEVL